MSLRGARKIFQTARSILKRNPVAHSLLEVLLTYPGIRVLFWYRIAHFMAFHRLYTIAGFLSQHAAKVTGISISPEAKIGKRVFIDHGIGVVIGATAMIEDDARPPVALRRVRRSFGRHSGGDRTLPRI